MIFNVESTPPGTCVLPLINTIQKIALYETKSTLYIVGSNNTQTTFRILKIDRQCKELVISDDKVEYNQKKIRDILTAIDLQNVSGRSKQGQRYGSGLNRTVSAFGIVGFVKFLEGYYIILITKRRRVAVIGHHTIYKIEDTSMIYVPQSGDKHFHPDEYSYSYDLTHTLQYNLALLNNPMNDTSTDVEQERSAPYWNPQMNAGEGSVEIADNFLASLQPKGEDYIRIHSKLHESPSIDDTTYSSDGAGPELWSELHTNNRHHYGNQSEGFCYGIRTYPQWKFVWNSYLIKDVDLHADWLLFMTHGFVGQSNVSVYGKPIFMTLIARRSNRFAGTRFLKRGANGEGDVANEVETEQIVHDSSVSSLINGHYTAFVQMRGSIPSHWSQDISKMVPKPAIGLDLADPYCYTSGRHFNQLLKRYGSPILVLNLVKKREQKRHESMLSDEFINAITYLNQFLAPQHQMEHIGLDMARINKLKESNVMGRLSDISYYVLRRLGIFQSWSPFNCHRLLPHPLYGKLGGFKTVNGSILQTGVVRVNCVDCLDRTNTAQFALGKCALAFQMYALGVLDKPTLEFDTDSVRMLEELYEDHGDTLALQYGGSQLVHRIKTYRKISPLSSHSRDIMQTLSRYFSNTFSDADKQNAINLFLGVYKPSYGSIPLWELTTDYYLHNTAAVGRAPQRKNLYTQWWDSDVAASLPLPYDEVKKGLDGSLLQIAKNYMIDERVDGYFEHYRPYEMTVLSELFLFNMSHSIRDFMPHFATAYSPFSVRVRPGKRKESMGTDKPPPPPNPSVSGMSSTASTSSSTSDTDSDEFSDDDPKFLLESDSSSTSSEMSSSNLVTFESIFPTMKQVYGKELKQPDEHDLKMYKRFVGIGKLSCSTPLEDHSYGDKLKTPTRSFLLIQNSAFPLDSSRHMAPPNVLRTDKEIYRAYIQRGQVGSSPPSIQSLHLYQRYISRWIVGFSFLNSIWCSPFDLARMVISLTKYNPYDLARYGNNCGFGAKLGVEPVDEIDRCCQHHDKCYDNSIQTCKNEYPLWVNYKYSIRPNEKKPLICDGRQEACSFATCVCDTTLITCLKDNDKYFREANLRLTIFN